MAGGWAHGAHPDLFRDRLAIILERFWSLRRASVLPPQLGEQKCAIWARTRKLDPAHIEQLRANSPLGELLAAALAVRPPFARGHQGAHRDTGGTWCTAWSASSIPWARLP